MRKGPFPHFLERKSSLIKEEHINFLNSCGNGLQGISAILIGSPFHSQNTNNGVCVCTFKIERSAPLAQQQMTNDSGVLALFEARLALASCLENSRRLHHSGCFRDLCGVSKEKSCQVLVPQHPQTLVEDPEILGDHQPHVTPTKKRVRATNAQ